MTTLLLASLVPNKLYGLILAALLALPGVRDEGHLVDVASGITSATLQATCSGDWADTPGCVKTWPGRPEELAALLVTMGYWESKFLARIGRGKCEKWECDAYKAIDGRIHHKARGYFQIQASPAVTTYEWRHMIGSGEYRAFVASSTAARLLGRHYAGCKTIQGAISGYATGGRCSWRQASARMTTYKASLTRLQTPVRRPAAVPAEPAAVAYLP
jgi:hypothetical protein